MQPQGFQGQCGVSLVATPEFQTTSTGFSGVFNAASAAKPDALVVQPPGRRAVALAKQYAALGRGSRSDAPDGEAKDHPSAHSDACATRPAIGS